MILTKMLLWRYISLTLMVFIHESDTQCIPLPKDKFVSDRILSDESSDLMIIDGDIAVQTGSFLRRQSSRLLSYDELVWPDNIVPFDYHKSITNAKQHLIEAAIQYWQEETCIQFRRKLTTDEYWITFRADSTGCYSFIGRDKSCYGQGQPISISNGCDSKNVIRHEIGHAVGLLHQHSRADRDDNVHINWEHIPKSSQYYFKKENVTSLGVPYDYTSLMQYNAFHFSRDVLVKTSMVTMDPRYQRFLGKAQGLSYRDKQFVHILYKCNQTCDNLASENCSGTGFLKRTTFSNTSSAGGCKCECPPTASGEQCELEMGDDYYEASDQQLACGGNVTSEGFLETPGFPMRRKPMQSCVWVIKAPSDKRIQLDFYGFEFAPRNNNQTGDSTANKCQSESVEIRLNDRFKGTFYCGRDIKDGTKLSSNGSQVIIIVNADDRMVGSGLRVWVSFERSDSVVGLKQKTNRQPEKVPFNPLAVPVNIFSTILNMIAQRLRVLSEG